MLLQWRTVEGSKQANIAKLFAFCKYRDFSFFSPLVKPAQGNAAIQDYKELIRSFSLSVNNGIRLHLPNGAAFEDSCQLPHVKVLQKMRSSKRVEVALPNTAASYPGSR